MSTDKFVSLQLQFRKKKTHRIFVIRFFFIGEIYQQAGIKFILKKDKYRRVDRK